MCPQTHFNSLTNVAKSGKAVAVTFKCFNSSEKKNSVIFKIFKCFKKSICGYNC